MELIVILVLGLIAGVAIGNAVGTVRSVRRRRPRDLAVDAELQAARQRAERAAGEAQALRTKLAAAEVTSARVAELETDLAAAYEDAERNAELATRLESEIATLRGGRRPRAADPGGTGARRAAATSARASTGAPAIPDVTVPVVARDAVVIPVAEPGPQPVPQPRPLPTGAEALPDVDARDRMEMLVMPVMPEAAAPPPAPAGLEATAVDAPDVPIHDVPAGDAAAPAVPVRPRRAAPDQPPPAIEPPGPSEQVDPPLAVDALWVEPPAAVEPPPAIDAAPAVDAPLAIDRPPAIAVPPASVEAQPAQAPIPDAEVVPVVPPRTRPRPQPAPVAIAAPDPHPVPAPDVASDPLPAPTPGTVEVVPAVHPHGWRPIRPGLSDPWTWLGTTSPAGIPYAEDDLQSVHGVGPYLARRLREEGVLTWRQVAEWDEDDMTLVSRRIGSFPDRIRREDWSGAARELHQARYGERLP